MAENKLSTLPESLVDVNAMADRTKLKTNSYENSKFLVNSEMRKKIDLGMSISEDRNQVRGHSRKP